MNAEMDEKMKTALAIAAWENEGGASKDAWSDNHYGRRIESDRTWTVYNVFTGVPAHHDSKAMSGLSRMRATQQMLALNRSEGV
ncbi:MAG: hypothetical protein Rhirs2KO_20080 [Rhizobiaceae bacterium]